MLPHNRRAELAEIYSHIKAIKAKEHKELIDYMMLDMLRDKLNYVMETYRHLAIKNGMNTAHRALKQA